MFKKVNLELEANYEQWLKEHNHEGKVTRTYHFNSLSQISDRTAKFTCPFNMGHIISRGTYTKHIAKCKRNPNFSHYVECPFNFGHQFASEQEMIDHIKDGECPDAEEHTEKMRAMDEHYKNRALENFEEDE